jgi:L-amino acid N-acyltransferase YncA
MGKSGMLKIRPARMDDIEGITEIYNDAIITTTATFDTEPISLEDQKTWFLDHNLSYPVLVAEFEGHIVGWASLSKWSNKKAYSRTVELSIYMDKRYQGKGFGRNLMEAIIREGKKAGVHTILSRIAKGNEVSLHLHEVLGFDLVGVMREVGRKFDQLLDVYLLQLLYKK